MKSSRVVKTPSIYNGDACIGTPCIQVWVLVSLRQEGASDRDLLESHPTLKEDDLDAAWEYADKHWEEIDQAIEQHGQKLPEDLNAGPDEG